VAGFVHRSALRLFGRLPATFRRRVVRVVSPSFTVGAMCVIERDDGSLLLVRHSYRQRWGVPGGLLKRAEDVEAGARREVFEEVGLMIELLGEPAVVVDPEPQRVDVVFRCRPAAGTDTTDVTPRSAEIVEARWFRPDKLPELQFETAGALVRLARASVPAGDRRLPDPVWPRFDRSR
jgi:8-oxo-dGTP diphosphatase